MMENKILKKSKIIKKKKTETSSITKRNQVEKMKKTRGCTEECALPSSWSWLPAASTETVLYFRNAKVRDNPPFCRVMLVEDLLHLHFDDRANNKEGMIVCTISPKTDSSFHFTHAWQAIYSTCGNLRTHFSSSSKININIIFCKLNVK